MARIRIGTDILSQDPKDLIFDTDQACMVLVNEMISSLSESGAGDVVRTVAHGLDYRPAFDVYQEVEGSPGTWSKEVTVLNLWADTTNINFHLFEGSETYRFKIVLYANSQDGEVGGSLSNADGRIQVARDGFSLDGVTDLRQLIFSSKKGVMMNQEKRTITVVTAEGIDQVFTESYAHGMGYIPEFDAILSENGLPLPYFLSIPGTGSGYYFNVTADDTNIICTAECFGDEAEFAENVDFRVNILCGKIE